MGSETRTLVLDGRGLARPRGGPETEDPNAEMSYNSVRGRAPRSVTVSAEIVPQGR